MKINEVITEYETLDPNEYKDPDQRLEEQYKQLTADLERTCQPYLSQVGGADGALFKLPLYRGLSNDEFNKIEFNKPNNVVATINIRQDRRPKDTPFQVQTMIDDWFQKHTGYRFRSAGLFATGRKGLASGYGYPVVVIPKGPFHYCWSPNYGDMYEELEMFADRYSEEDEHHITALGAKQKIMSYFTDPEKVDDFMDMGDYRIDKDLARGINSGHEMMLVCNQAVLIAPDWLAQIHYLFLNKDRE